MRHNAPNHPLFIKIIGQAMNSPACINKVAKICGNDLVPFFLDPALKVCAHLRHNHRITDTAYITGVSRRILPMHRDQIFFWIHPIEIKGTREHAFIRERLQTIRRCGGLGAGFVTIRRIKLHDRRAFFDGVDEV